MSALRNILGSRWTRCAGRIVGLAFTVCLFVVTLPFNPLIPFPTFRARVQAQISNWCETTGVSTQNCVWYGLRAVTFNGAAYVGSGILYATSSNDMGAQMNAIYTNLPTNGGKIFLVQKSDGSCYSYSTPITMNTAGKYVEIEGLGIGGSNNSGAFGACLNYTPTTATSALLMDYANVTVGKGGSGHGLKNITLINNNCVTTGGCGSSAIGLDSGTTNGGTYEATFLNVSLYGFGTCYRDLNNGSVDVTWINLNWEACTVGMTLNSPTGIHFSGGTIAGNGKCILANTTNSNPNVDIVATQFFTNGNPCIDGTNITSGTMFMELHDAHMEFIGGTNPFVSGKIDLTLIGGLMEDDSTTSTLASWITVNGNNIDVEGTLFTGGGRTATTLATVNNGSGKMFGKFGFGNQALFTNIVTGTSSANVSVFMSQGSAANPLPFYLNAPMQVNEFSSAVATCKANVTCIFADGTNGGALKANINNLSGYQSLLIGQRGTGACVTSTLAVTFSPAFTNTPIVVVSDQTTAGGARISTGPSNTGFTVTCTGATDTFAWMASANPN